jgi:hypothetical protein
VGFSFASGFDGWEPSYSDYTQGVGQEVIIAFAFGHERLPTPLDNTSGVYLQAHNRSDDLFMYMTRQVAGLSPNTDYKVELSITFASNVPPGCVGIGGAPGESVYLKGGATGTKPANIIIRGNYVSTNFDHGGQSQEGANTLNLGNFAHGGGTCGDGGGIYQKATLSTGGRGVTVRTTASGELWLILGTDSGFEGFTKIYYLEGSATITRL